MSQVDELKKAIETISEKQHVISKEARYAQEQFDDRAGVKPRQERQLEDMMKNFNESVAILMKVFSTSRFDEVMGLVANPFRLILLNFCVAFFRGIGFVFGLIAVLYLVFAVFGDVSFAQWFAK